MESNLGPEALWPVLGILMVGQAGVCGVLAQIIADSNGHPRVRWFWIGFFLSIVGVLWATKLRDVSDR